MTTLVAGSHSAVSTDSLDLPDLQSGTITKASENMIVVSFGPGSQTEFYGSFGYDAGGNLAGGTLTAVRDVTAGDTVFTLSGLNVPALTFVGWVTSGATATARAAILADSDVLTGSPFNDVLRGYTGNDIIMGGAGDDTLDGGPGINHIDGGAGTDVAVRGATRAASSFLSYNGAVHAGDSTGYDVMVGVEYIRFSDQTVAGSSAPVFDPLSYLAANPDLAAGFGVNADAALNHYLTAGYREGRPSSFDALAYLAANPDLAAGFGVDTAAATQHYLQSGRLEGRSTAFSGMSYLAANPDLIAGYGADSSAATQHYILAGRTEGRPTTFNAAAYLARNPDLQASFGTPELAATHYVLAGYREGRSAAPLSSTGLPGSGLPGTATAGILAAA